MPQPYGKFGHPWGQLAGFEDDGIARQQCRNDMAIGQMAGKVERTKNGNHTMGSVPQYRTPAGDFGFPGARALLQGFYGDIDLADHGGHFGTGFPQGFAGFEADLMGKLLLMFLKQLAKSADDGLSFLQRSPRP